VARLPPEIVASVGVIGASLDVDALRLRLAAAGVSVRLPDNRATNGADVCWDAIRALASDVTAIVTLLATEERLRATLGACAAARDRDLVVLDLTPVSPATQREFEAVLSAARVTLLGGRLLARLRDGVVRPTLYVDENATNAPALRGLLSAFADDVVATGAPGRAKALGLVDDLLGGFNTAAVDEALTIGRRAGLDIPKLMALLQKGSGATTLMAHADILDLGPTARRQAIARVVSAAQQADHSLWFGSVAIGVLMAQSQSAAQCVLARVTPELR
jgi:3-hydroxyisobutyrate dehydrogenase-like beta-hydroxyacid dehydrogenase